MRLKNNARLVYSTETSGKCPVCGWPQRDCQCSTRREADAPVPSRIVAKLRMEKKGRGGKTVTVVYGLPQNDDFLKEYSLFRTTTRNGRVHYFLATDTSKIPGGGIEELLHREWIIPDGYEMMMTNEWWKQYLINLSLSCGEQLTNQIKASSYNEKDITRLIEGINICKGGAIYQKPKPPALPRKRSRFGVAGSGFFYHLQTESGRSKFNSLHPAFGISYEAFSKRWPEKLAYYHELKYSSMEQPGIRQGNTLPATYSVQAIRLLTLIRLYFPNNKIAFYTNAGISNGIPIKSTGRIEGTQFTNPVVFTEFEKGRLEQGFVLGVGVKLNPSGAVSLSLETRYQYETAFINPSEFDTGKSLNFVAVLQF